MMGMTAQQTALLEFINKAIRERGIPPTIRECADALDFKSTSNVHRLMIGLEERGLIRRLYSRARAIEVIEHQQQTLRDVVLKHWNEILIAVPNFAEEAKKFL